MRKSKFSVAVSLFYSFCISVVVNYIVTYVFRPPAVYNILPMLPAVLLRVRYLRAECTKPWQYVHAAVMLVISFLFYVVMYRKLWALNILFAGILMTLVLALWCVLCVESKISLRKKDVGYLLLFIVVCGLYGVLVWTHYNRRAEAAINYIVENNQPETVEAGDIDGLCQEIDRVLLGGDNVYKFWDLADRYRRHVGSYEAEYRELQELVKNPGSDKIHALMNANSSPRE